MNEKEGRKIVEPSEIKRIVGKLFSMFENGKPKDIPYLETFTPEYGVQPWPIKDFVRDIKANDGKILPSAVFEMPDFYRFVYDKPDKVLANIEVTDKTAIGMILAELVDFAEDARAEDRINPKVSWFGPGKSFFLMDIVEVFPNEGSAQFAQSTPEEWEDEGNWPYSVEIKSYDVPMMGTSSKSPVYITLYYDK